MPEQEKLKKLRNIGIAAHIDAGKTTVTERVLYYTGRTHRMGNVDDGTAAMDWKPQEQERGITIVSAATSCFWQNEVDRQSGKKDRHHINIIDTPGHVDFTAEVERCMGVLDGVVLVFCGVGGVEAQTETVWHQAQRYSIPRLCFVNKLDRPGSDVHRVTEDLRKKLAAEPVLLQLPVFEGDEFVGVIDLIERCVLYYEEKSLGARYEVLKVPEERTEEMEKQRAAIIETTAERVGWLADKYLADEQITSEEIKSALREATSKNALQPVLCGAALRNRGVQPLLDAACDYLPSPLEAYSTVGAHPSSGDKIERHAESDDPFSALVFKVQSEKHGDLFFIRVYSGTIKARSRVYNANKERMEHVQQIYRMHADQREQVQQAGAGEIVAALGLKVSTTGDTLCQKKHPIVFESMHFPNTVVSMAIEPKTQAEKGKLDEALEKLAREDPTFQAGIDKQTGQLLVSGMGELHLDIIKDRLLREYNVGANVGEPQVSYRESIREPVEVDSVFDSERDGRGHYARVKMRFEPDNDIQGVEFVNEVNPKVCPPHFVRAVESSFTGMVPGPIFGYPLIHFKAVLVDAETHPVDSTEMAFEAAAGRALRDALDDAELVLLEPYMRIEVVVPELNMGDVISYVSTCRGEVKDVGVREHLRVIRAQAPLSSLFGFAGNLRSLTQGRGSYSMEPFAYKPAPKELMEST